MPLWLLPMPLTGRAVPRSRYSTRLWLASWKRFWHRNKTTSGMYRASSSGNSDRSRLWCAGRGLPPHRLRHLQTGPPLGILVLTLLHTILGRRATFPFPKSIYSVADALAAVVRTRPNALILDFFAGSG